MTCFHLGNEEEIKFHPKILPKLNEMTFYFIQRNSFAIINTFVTCD